MFRWPEKILLWLLFVLLLCVPAEALEGRTLLGSSAKAKEPAGWSDRRAVLVIESFGDGDKMRERRAETKELLGEDLKLSALSEFLGPADFRGLRVLDVWGAEEPGSVHVWAPGTDRFHRVPSGQSDDKPGHENEPSYRDAQLLDLLPRMVEELESVEVVDEEVVDGTNMAVLDVDVGDRDWPMGQRFRVWISTDDGLLRKIETVKAGGVARRVSVLEYTEADGRVTATRVAVETFASKRKTIFERRDVEYDRGIPERTFSLRDLSKGN